MRSSLVALALVGCAPPVAPRYPDATHTRAALGHMTLALHAAAVQCTAYAQTIGRRFDFGEQSRADAVATSCINAIIPPRDALYFASQNTEPWGPGSLARIACAGASVRVHLERLRLRFDADAIPIPPVMNDGIRLGLELEGYAMPGCDPLRPTTTVTVTYPPLPVEDPNE